MAAILALALEAFATLIGLTSVAATKIVLLSQCLHHLHQHPQHLLGLHLHLHHLHQCHHIHPHRPHLLYLRRAARKYWVGLRIGDLMYHGGIKIFLAIVKWDASSLFLS